MSTDMSAHINQTELTDWLRDMAEGPMAHNPEHTDTCNMLTAARVEIERLQRALTDTEQVRDLRWKLWKEVTAECCRLQAIVDRLPKTDAEAPRQRELTT
jgi:uncharacterized protein YfdQ (DUF2303 family)